MSTVTITQETEASLPVTALKTGLEARLAARKGYFTKSTSGVAPTYLQANLIILPSKYASDFRDLCARNPVPCPLVAESSKPGDYAALKSYLPPSVTVCGELDLRTDCPHFNVFQDSQLKHSYVPDILDHWTSNHVAFLVGCSFSFETALTAAGLPPRQALQDRNVPMYRSNIPLAPAGVFTGATWVVSMRPYKKADIEKVRAITRPYLVTHGEPVAWGWDAVKKLGIANMNEVQWGEPPLTLDGRPLGDVFGDDENVPVFWGCGVTPQEAVMRAGLEGTVMSHAPGHMLLLDCKEDDVLK